MQVLDFDVLAPSIDDLNVISEDWFPRPLEIVHWGVKSSWPKRCPEADNGFGAYAML